MGELVSERTPATTAAAPTDRHNRRAQMNGLNGTATTVTYATATRRAPLVRSPARPRRGTGRSTPPPRSRLLRPIVAARRPHAAPQPDFLATSPNPSSPSSPIHSAQGLMHSTVCRRRNVPVFKTCPPVTAPSRVAPHPDIVGAAAVLARWSEVATALQNRRAGPASPPLRRLGDRGENEVPSPRPGRRD